ncbi:aromatic alcohol reductase [Shewanella youngdeokensis]|uniref:Aromatic alcohol reductase n=1 Tax=Shewanella youngdeokensis TaxID=2999068 RepID=A0ABZ0K3U4_9GAMM|nr:aromatic alcohol reductase [Shewanella sp. DAU334]
MSTSKQQTVAVIGATGQVGYPLTQALLALGHKVIVLTRGLQNEGAGKLSEFKANGAQIIEITDMSNKASMIVALQGADTLVSCVPGAKAIITELEPIWLEAAIAAGVKRFVPTEFGCHTRGLEYGDGVLFDYKKDLHKKILGSGIGWTMIYTGGIFDYFLPNLRYFRKITTLGNMDIPIYVHDINDIGRLAALAVTDERTLNRCVQLDYNALTQNEMLALLKQYHPDTQFEYEYFSEQFITEQRLVNNNGISAKKGAETDQERWGINYVNYVIGKLASFTDETLRATELYPDFKLCRTPAQAIADPEFIFEKT